VISDGGMDGLDGREADCQNTAKASRHDVRGIDDGTLILAATVDSSCTSYRELSIMILFIQPSGQFHLCCLTLRSRDTLGSRLKRRIRHMSKSHNIHPPILTSPKSISVSRPVNLLFYPEP
jgi:hypothetical protein